jgi:hypothetical protein
MNNLSKLLFIAILMVATSIAASAGELKPNTKLGKPTKDELSMTQYDKDPSASALYLAKLCNVRYTFNKSDGMLVEYEYITRVKILKEEGKKYATVAVDYFDNGDGLMVRNERIGDIQCTTYNSDGGKVVKSKIDKKDITRDRVDPKHMVLKFTAEDVKVGSVIEYKYTIQSARLLEMRTWQQQEQVPVLYTDLEAGMIIYFQFMVNSRGKLPINASSSPSSVNYNVQDQYQTKSVIVDVTQLSYKTGPLPAETSTNKDDINAIDFTLGQIVLPWEAQRSADSAKSQTWKDRAESNNFSRDYTDDIDKKVYTQKEDAGIK